jgi:Mn2+/Fe2+ NRAMP family transporter
MSMSLMFAVDVFTSIFSQLHTAVVAGLFTYVVLLARHSSYDRQEGWTIALLVVLCLWAFFPHGFHVIAPPAMEPQFGGGLAPRAPNYAAMLVADVFLTVVGWGVGKWVFGRNH